MTSTNHTLVATKEIKDDFNESSFVIKYFISEKEKIGEEDPKEERIYGVRLMKRPKGGNASDDCFDAFLTQDRAHADRIIDKLITGFVTPRCAPEVIDYIYDETLIVS